MVDSRETGRRIIRMRYICEHNCQRTNLINKGKTFFKMITKTKTEKEYFCLYSLKLYFYGYFLTVHKFSDTSPFRMWGFVPPGPEYSEKQYLVDPCFFLHPISHFYYFPSPINISNISSLLNPAADGWLKPSKPFTQRSHYLSSRLPLPDLLQMLPPEWNSPRKLG